MNNLEWRKPEDYEHMKDYAPIRWAWEFLRRNPKYIQEWGKELPLELERRKKLLSDPETRDAPYLEGYRTNTPESTHFSIQGALSEYYKRWGILSLVNPEQDNPFPNPFNNYHSLEYGTVRGGTLEINMLFRQRNPLGTYRAMVFDISRPLKPQIANAQKILRDIQKYEIKTKKLKLITVRKQKEHWIEYLRIWDARINKVKYSEIAKIMFPRESNSYEDGYPTNTRIRKSYKKAKYLIEKGYREIAMTY